MIPIGLSVLVVWFFVSGVDRTLAPALDTALGFVTDETVLSLSDGAHERLGPARRYSS